jgi:hypothetical protein
MERLWKARQRALETPQRKQCRKNSNSMHMALLRANQTPEQVQQRKEVNTRNMAELRAQRREGLSHNIGKCFDKEISSVPKISAFVETKESMKNAFHHLLKTRIGFGEQLSDDILNFMKNKKNTVFDDMSNVLPIYEQVHQANVCVCCDWLMFGTEDLFWIKKSTLIQHKSRLNLEHINMELRSCCQVKDPELKELLLSPWARFKSNGEYLRCCQC